MGTSQAGQNKFTFFRWMFISDRDGVINLQVPTSQQAADIDDNRPMALPWPFFSVLRRPYRRRPWPDVSLPISFRYASELDHNQVYSTRSEEEFRVCVASLSLFLSFSLWSRATAITVARALSDDLEISLLLERGGVA